MNMPGRIARQMQRLAPTAGQQLKATPVLTNLGNLCHLVNSCNMQSGVKHLEQVFLEPAIAADGMQYLLCVPDASTPITSQLDTLPAELQSHSAATSASCSPPVSAPADIQPEAAQPIRPAVGASVSVTSAPAHIDSAPVIHATANTMVQAAVPDHSYRDAVSGHKEQVQVYDVSMPTVSGKLDFKGEDIQRRFAMDTGCSASCISEEAFERDQHLLLRYGRLYNMATPTKVTMLGKQVTQACKVIKHARVYIGQAYYITDLFVVPNCAFEYVLSAAWMTVYSATPCFRQGQFRIGVAPGTWNPRAFSKPQKGYQSVPMMWKGRQLSIPVVPSHSS